MSTGARLVWIVCLVLVSGAGRPAASSGQERREGFTVSGRVVGVNGEVPRNVSVWLGSESDGGFSAMTCQVEEDGRFESGLVPPGNYVVDASSPGADPTEVGTSGFVAVTVRNADVDGLVVPLRPSAKVKGAVKFESERDPDAPHPRVTIRAVLAVERMRENHASVALTADDGTFELELHGPRLIRADAERGGNRTPWWMKAVRLDGVDVTNVPIDFVTKPSSRLEVVFSDRPTAVVGVVHDEAGLPVEGAHVLLFSKDASMWAAWSTSVQTGISDENGRFWFVDAMPAGDYRAIALRDGPPSTAAEAVDELPRLDKFATTIPVGESKVARIELINLKECCLQSNGATAPW
jgi:hypothetical protein